MALGALSLSVTSGVQGRPFQATIYGLTTGKVEVIDGGAPGFSVVNGKVMSNALPYSDSVLVLREYDPGVGAGYLDSRIPIAGMSRVEIAAIAAAMLNPGDVSPGSRIAESRLSDGTTFYEVVVSTAAGAEYRSMLTPPTKFSEAVASFTKFRDYTFGTGAAPAGSTRISNTTELAVDWDAFEHGTGTTTINFEAQRYRDFAAGNHQFTADALELIATIDTPAGGPQVKTTTFASAAANTRTIQVADASNIYIGSVVSVANQNDQLHRILSMCVRSTMSAGRTFTITVRSEIGEFAEQSTTITATGADTTTTIAAQVVAWINANAVLASRGITAIINPQLPSCYYLTWPRRTTGPAIGQGAVGSVDDVSVTSSSSIGTFAVAQNYSAMHVIDKSGTTITLNQPITAAAGAALSISPARFLHRNTAYSGAGTTATFNDITGIEQGQLVSFGYIDSNNIRRITAPPAANTLTFEASIGLTDGNHVVVYPAFGLLTSASNSGDNTKLTFATSTIPAGLQIGHRVFFANLANTAEVTITAIDRTNKIVTMSGQGTSVGSGARIHFYPNIGSAQIWSKWFLMPEVGQSAVAMELTSRVPNLAALGAWPAFWQFADPTDPNPTPGGSTGGLQEIDWYEVYNTFNSPGKANNFMPGVPGAGNNGVTYQHPGYTASTGARGNNFGNADRKTAYIWQRDRWFLYLDDTLVTARGFVYNNYKRAQTGINLAVGVAYNSSLLSDGLFPVDLSQFPMKCQVKSLRVMTRA